MQREINGIKVWIILILLAVFVQSMLDRAVMGSANSGVETMCFWLCAGVLAYRGRETIS